MEWVLSFNSKNNLKFYLLCMSLVFIDSIRFVGTILLGYIVDEWVINRNLNILINFSLIAVAFIVIRIVASYIIVQRFDKNGNAYEGAIK